MRWLTTLLTGMVLSFGSLSAWVGYPSPGGWGIVGEYLYLLPTIDDTFFLFNPTDPTNTAEGTLIGNDFGFHSGFRVGAIYAFCDCNREFEVYYTRFNASHRRSVTGSLMSPLLGRTAFTTALANSVSDAVSDNELLYQKVDLLIGQQLYCCCGLELALRGGLEYAYLRLNREAFYAIVTPQAFVPGFYHDHSKLWGIGPEIGIVGDYILCNFQGCCSGVLAATFSTSGSLLSSRLEQNFTDQLEEADFLDVWNTESSWRIIPVWHARVGLNYATCFSCFGASLEAGYEFHVYPSSISRPIEYGTAQNHRTLTNSYNFGLQGLYVRAALTF